MDKVKTAASRIKIQKYIPFVLFVLMILVRLPFINKGIDYTDTGYNIEKYKYVFFGNGISDIGMFYTDLIGGLIYYAFSAYQLLIYRILHCIIWITTTFLAYRIFRLYVNRIWLLFFYFGLATQIGGEMIYSYYPMSQLLLLLSVIMLHTGMVKGRRWFFFAAGFVACINVFMRLTNVFYLFMCLSIFWFGWCSKQDKSIVKRNVRMFFVGMIAAGVFSVIMMSAFMGIDEVVNSISGYIKIMFGLSEGAGTNLLGVEEKSGHSLLAEVKIIGFQGIQAIVSFLSFALFIQIISFVNKKIFSNNGRSYIFRYTFTMIILLVWTIISVFFSKYFSGRMMYAFGLVSIVISILLMIVIRSDKPIISTLCLLNVLLSVFSVIGTDQGLQRFFIARTLQVGVLLIGEHELPLNWDKLPEISWVKKIKARMNTEYLCNWLRGYNILMCVSIFAVGVSYNMKTAYCDGDYADLIYNCSENISLVKGMYTSKTRAEELNQYYELMNVDKLIDNEVAIFGYFPLGLVIGPQRDYFEAVDPCVDYPRFSVDMLLEVIREKEENGIIPIIVLSQVDRIQRGRSEGTDITSKAKQAVIDYMLSLHEYEVYAETVYYTIYIPGEQK